MASALFGKKPRWLWVPAQGRDDETEIPLLYLHHLPRLERHKALVRNLRLVECRMQGLDRRVDCFIRQLKRAVMMRERPLGAAIGKRLDRIGRIHVLILHKPSRLIGANRQDREPQRAVCLTDAAEMLALAVTGIADDVDL